MTISQYRAWAEKTFVKIEEEKIENCIRFIVTEEKGEVWERLKCE